MKANKQSTWPDKKIVVKHITDGESTHNFTVSEDTDLTLVLLALHTKSVNTDVTVRLIGRNAVATIIGIIVASGKSQLCIHTMQIHEGQNGTSNLLIKTVLDDEAQCVVDGGIRVEKDAQKTDAYQRNENILLSEHAHAESKPSLEILANDVRCTHGATVGPVSDEELWYLKTRGISEARGSRLIVSGFLRSALDRVQDPKVREDLWQTIERAI